MRVGLQLESDRRDRTPNGENVAAAYYATTADVTPVISVSWLELAVDGTLDEDEAPLPEVFHALGIEVRTFHEKEMVRGRVKLAPEDLVVGGLPSVAAALRQMGRRLPEPIGYPVELRPLLKRRVWPSTLAEVRRRLAEGGAPLFVKPRAALKRFTGRVVADLGDLYPITSVSGSCPVWCSQVVEWVSEYRVFLLGGHIVGTCWYDGDHEIAADRSVIEECRCQLSTFTGAFDVGVLIDGATALVEINDGFSMGRYGLDANLYAQVLITRWQELIGAK